MIFLVTAMLSIGMQTRLTDLRSLALSGNFVFRTMLANFLVVPILGIAVAWLFPLQPHVAGALLILACTPGGLGALQFTSRVESGAPLASATLFLLSLTAVLISPLILEIVLPGNIELVMPYGRVLFFLVVFLIVPLFAGMVVLGRMPGAAPKVSRIAGVVSVIVFIAFMVVTGSKRQAAAGEIGGIAVLAMLVFIVLSIAVGWFLGGPTREFRRISATASSMRNAALCLAVVQASAPGHPVMVPLIAFSLLMVPPNMLFAIYIVVRARARPTMGT